MNSNQQDQSYIEKKYFINKYKYNCPFCNIRNVQYKLTSVSRFNWTNEKVGHIYLVKCSHCHKTSLHLSFEEIDNWINQRYYFNVEDIDSHIFYSRPTSFFVIDKRIPKIIRELITEAESCLKMNLLTGASACMRKAIYEFLDKEKARGKYYETKIKFLKCRYKNIVDPEYFDTLGHIQHMTSDKLHEASWPKWSFKYLKFIIETLKTILCEIYVLPAQKKDKSKEVKALLEDFKGRKEGKTKPSGGKKVQNSP